MLFAVDTLHRSKPFCLTALAQGHNFDPITIWSTQAIVAFSAADIEEENNLLNFMDFRKIVVILLYGFNQGQKDQHTLKTKHKISILYFICAAMHHLALITCGSFYRLSARLYLSFFCTCMLYSPSNSFLSPAPSYQSRVFSDVRASLCTSLPTYKRRQSARGFLTTVSVLDKMFKDFSSGISEMLGGASASDVAQLRGALGDAEFSAVKATISKLMAKQREEMRELQNRNLEQARQMQKELNQYSNKVRDLEFQLIVAATEVTDLEEQISSLKAGEPLQ